MIFEMSQKTKFFILASSIFFGVSCVVSGVGFLLSLRLSYLLFGPLSGIGGWIHGLAGVIGLVFSLLVGTLIALVINLKIGKKWREEFAPSEEEGNYERIRLTCLSFLAFLVLLWGLIVAIAEF